MNTLRNYALIGFLVSLAWGGQAAEAVYKNDFEKADKVPEDFLVLDGAFEVKEEGGNKFLELPGAPLDTFGVLFGPSERGGTLVSARIYGTSKGRRSPTFAVGLKGIAGYRLQVAPAKKQLELVKGEVVKSSVPFTWESGQWTHLRLQVRPVKGGGWKVEGRAWTDGKSEPAEWMISAEESEELSAGRASAFGSPFSGTPIRFDDVAVERVEAAGSE